MGARMTRVEELERLRDAVQAGEFCADSFDAAFDAGSEGTRHLARACEAFHGDMNAALALHRALLPRHYAQVHMWPMPEMSRVDIGGGHTGRDDSPSRAWLIAILNALIAQEPDAWPAASAWRAYSSACNT